MIVLISNIMLIFIVHILIDINLLTANFITDFLIIILLTMILSWSFILKDIIYDIYE